ncbi:MAG: MraY family glycosyltransferase [Candidatus Omnitrophota bacterium]
MSLAQIIDTFLIAFIVSYLLTPFVRVLAVKLDYLDHPKNNKVHAHPTPLLGGLSIFAGFVVAVLTKSKIMAMPSMQAMFLGVFILLIIGLIDDKMGMMPNIKLLGQFLAAMVLVKSGLCISFMGNYYINILVTYIWIIGITNSFNLLDNMNGLSAGLAAIAAIFFAIIAYLNGQFAVAALSLALAGCSLGFLRYNFPRASLFMGDSGSLVLGYVLSALAIMSGWQVPVITISVAVPLLVLGYPIFDTTLVSVMRVLERRSVFQGGKDHSSHRLALLGFKRYKAVLAIYGICLLLGITAIIVLKTSVIYGICMILFAVIVMIGFGVRLSFVDTRSFGRKKGINEI